MGEQAYQFADKVETVRSINPVDSPRPRINWKDTVNKDLQRMGLTWEEVEASAQDRQTWRQRVALRIEDAG